MRYGISLFICSVMILSAGCASAPVPEASPEELAAAQSKKITVAIMDFGEDAANVKGFDAAAVAVLENMLVNAGRVNIVERNRIKQILSEQNLAAAGLLDQKTAVRVGRLLGVKEMIMGEVLAANLRGPVLNRTSETRRKGEFVSARIWDEIYGVIKLSIKTVDVETGLINYSGIKKTEKGLAINSVSYRNEDAYKNALKQKRKDKKAELVADLILRIAKRSVPKDELDSQYRDLLVDTMQQAVQSFQGDLLKHYSLKAKVLKKISEKTVMINLGSASGIRMGDRLEVWREGEALTDPSTGIVTTPKSRIAKVKVTQITSGLTCIVKGSKKSIRNIREGDQVITSR